MTSKDQQQDPKASRTDTSGNGAQHHSDKKGQEAQDRTNLAANRNATGPRTEAGKKRSSKNAIKFGIFSTVTLLADESRAEYESLREALWKSKQPGDEFEEVLLDKIASNLWRQRRVLIAEGAEIRRNSEFVVFDRQEQESKEAEAANQRVYAEVNPRQGPLPVGLIWSIENPDVLDRCIEILAELKKKMQSNGFGGEADWSLLNHVYGTPVVGHLRRSLQDNYLDWVKTSKFTEEERVAGGYASPEQCKKEVVKEIGIELDRLKHYKEEHNSIVRKRTEVEILRQRVPDGPELDRLLRYTSTLERSFDRMLTQYDRAQRIRKGQPLPPEVNVKIS